MNIKEEDMSKSSEVRSVIYDLLKTNGNCTLEEVKKESANRGIELDSKSNTIGLAMGQLLKKDPNIKRTGRGAYEYIQSDKTANMVIKEETDRKECSNAAEIARLEKLVVDIIQKSRNFDLMTGTDEDIYDIRECIKNIQHLYKTIEKELAGN